MVNHGNLKLHLNSAQDRSSLWARGFWNRRRWWSCERDMSPFYGFGFHPILENLFLKTGFLVLWNRIIFKTLFVFHFRKQNSKHVYTSVSTKTDLEKGNLERKWNQTVSYFLTLFSSRRNTLSLCWQQKIVIQLKCIPTYLPEKKWFLKPNLFKVILFLKS